MHKLALAPHVRELIVNVSGRTFADKPEGGVMDVSDQVKRLEHFKAEHPEWSILSPADIRSELRGEKEWRAQLGPYGEPIRAMELRELLDVLEARTTEGKR